jgi:outer membrane autotransporter protein
MKPKLSPFRRLLLPAVIVLPVMSGISMGAVIFPDGTGNVTITAGTPSDNYIQTGFGVAPLPANKTITIAPGVTLQPLAGVDVIEIQVANANNVSYTVINDGTLQSDNGPGNYGISTAELLPDINPSVRVLNNGTIAGAGAIRANNQLFLTNSGTLTGTSGVDASVFAKNGAEISNTGTISALIHGIQGENGTLYVTNYNLISGNVLDGINTPGVLNLQNNVDLFDTGNSMIQGGRNGVYGTGANSIVRNEGWIVGTTDHGAQLGASASVYNTTTYDIGEPLLGGLIWGGTHGIVAGNVLYVNNEQLGSIRGESGYGILAGTDAVIYNYHSITGGQRGIQIAGGFIGNVGLIEGDDYGVYVDAGGGSVNLYSSGRVVTDNGTAFLGNTGSDYVQLLREDPSLFDQGYLPYTYNGSEVLGDINGGAGYDVLNFSGGLTEAGGYTNVVYGNIQMEEINKYDGGVALIGDIDNSYLVDADFVSITGGGLYINGVLNGLNFFPTITANGAALGGTGMWNADVDVVTEGLSAGSIPIHLAVNPEDAVGLLEINGDVIHSPGSHLRVDIIPGVSINEGVNSDLIVQNGAATYDIGGAAVRVSPTNLDEVIFQGFYTLVDSDQPIIGVPGPLELQINENIIDTGFISGAYRDFLESGGQTFSLSDTVFTQYFAGVFVDGTDLVLGVDYLNFDFSTLPGLSENQVSLVYGLGEAVLGGSAEAEDLAAALLYSDLETVNNWLQSIVSPAEAALAYSTSIINTNYRLNRQIADHLAVARASSTVSVPMGMSVESSKGGGVVDTPITTRGNLWGSFSYDRQDYDGDEGDFDADSGAFTAGIDYRVAPNFILGAILDGSKTDSDEFGDIDSFRAGIYGTWGASTGLYVDFLAAYGWHELDFTDANSIQANLTVGYAIGNEEFKHGPFAGLEYQNVDFDSFNSGLIDVDGFDVDSFRALVGYRINANYGVFRPYASLAYAHEFEDGSNSVDASVFGGGFRVRGGELGSAVIATLGTGIAFTPTLTMNIGYRGEISVESDGLSSHGGSLGLNWAF